MIQPNELRQGVLVSEHESCNDGHIQTVEGININGFDPGGILLGNGDVYEPDELYPIPITEEWLLSFGFEPNLGVFTKSRSEELGHDFGNFSVSFYDDTQMKVWKGGRYIGVIGSCGFVHQFQNLTFALTGQELTIKIKQ